MIPPKVVDCVIGVQEEMGMPDGMWLMDTGCCHDLIGEKDIEVYPVETLIKEHAPTFSTANGRITATMVSPMYSEVLQETSRPYVLSETPSADRWKKMHGTRLFLYLVCK